VEKLTAGGKSVGMIPNPTIAAYNQTSMGANQSVQTLIKILDALDDKSLADYNSNDERL
jgi:hypothetical protein